MTFRDTAASVTLRPMSLEQLIEIAPQKSQQRKHKTVPIETLIKKPAFPYDTSRELEKMIDYYSHRSRAQNVSFRKLVSWMKVGERATHYVHSYPAKLLPQIAHFFIAASSLSKKGDTILDPFGGTGTVALEAILSGRKAYFADVNPLAQLIASVKTRVVKKEALERGLIRIQSRHAQSARKKLPPPEVVNLNYWYSAKTIRELTKIKHAILKESDRSVREFFLIAFSSTCRKVSFADPRLSVPVRLKNEDEIDEKASLKPWAIFSEQVSSNVKRMDNLRNFLKFNDKTDAACFVGNDARSLRAPKSDTAPLSIPLRTGSIPMIITSPPYAGAQKYIRASSLSLGWLDLAAVAGLKPLENASIGREHFRKAACVDCPSTGIAPADRLIKRVHKSNPIRSVIVATYLNEMDLAIREMARVLKPDGYLVLVVGNNEVCGHAFKSSEYLATLAEKYGLVTKLKLIDAIRSRGLMTKRNKSASVITREWVLLFQKPRKKTVAKPRNAIGVGR